MQRPPPFLKAPVVLEPLLPGGPVENLHVVELSVGPLGAVYGVPMEPLPLLQLPGLGGLVLQLLVRNLRLAPAGCAKFEQLAYRCLFL